MVRVFLLCATLVLAACGNVDRGSSTAPPISAATGTLTVIVQDDANHTPQAGIVVSIGATGTNFQTTDAQGKAVFTGLPIGAVDIHAFDDANTRAVSYYGVNTSTATLSLPSPTGSFSYVNVGLNVTNPNATSGQTVFFKTANETTRGIVVAGKASIPLSVPAGTTVTGTLYAVQGGTGFTVPGVATTVAGNTLYGSGSELVSLGTQTFTTTAAAAAATQTFNATFTTPSPSATALATINTFTPPGVLNANFLDIGGVQVSPTTGVSVALPEIINSVSVSNNWTVNATNAAGTLNWMKSGTFTTGGTIAVTPLFSGGPSFATGQTGGNISWTNAVSTTPVEFTVVNISAAARTWQVVVNGTTNTIALPNLPAGAAGPLLTGSAYDLAVANITATGISNVGQLSSLSTFESSVHTIAGAYTH